MKLWAHPPNYLGASWDGWYVFLAQTRDSDCLTRSNFQRGFATLQTVMSSDLKNPTVVSWMFFSLSLTSAPGAPTNVLHG